MKFYLDEGAYMPERAHETDAGMDLRAPKYTIVPARGSATVDTGVHAAIPAGLVGMLKSKSGLNVKKGLVSEGVIDAGYTGSIVVKLYNHSDEGVVIQRGEKVTQLVLMRCELCDVEEVEWDEYEKASVNSGRGDGGFGSSGR